jgi:hypothetical protein
VATIAVDFALTLTGQPPDYWQQVAAHDEGNPFFEWFLVRGPVFFTLTSLGYMALVGAVVTWLPRRAGMVAALAFTFGHFFGASTWLEQGNGLGVSSVIAFGIALATALVLGLR